MQIDKCKIQIASNYAKNVMLSPRDLNFRRALSEIKLDHHYVNETWQLNSHKMNCFQLAFKRYGKFERKSTLSDKTLKALF